MKNFFVTQPTLPPLEEFIPYLEDIWQSKRITNNGKFHQQFEKELDIKMKYTKLPPRGSDQKVFIADLSKVKKMIGWEPNVSKEDGIRKMIRWIMKS